MLVERRGTKETRRPLSALRSLRLSARPRRNALLVFPRAAVLIPSQSWRGPGGFDDQAAGFAAFVRAVAAAAAEAAPAARFLSGAPQVRSGLVSLMLLLGAGAAMLLAFALMADFADFGVALAARLVFVLFLAWAALPWVDRRAGTFDPRAVPPELLGDG